MTSLIHQVWTLSSARQIGRTSPHKVLGRLLRRSIWASAGHRHIRDGGEVVRVVGPVIGWILYATRRVRPAELVRRSPIIDSLRTHCNFEPALTFHDLSCAGWSSLRRRRAICGGNVARSKNTAECRPDLHGMDSLCQLLVCGILSLSSRISRTGYDYGRPCVAAAAWCKRDGAQSTPRHPPQQRQRDCVESHTSDCQRSTTGGPTPQQRHVHTHRSVDATQSKVVATHYSIPA